MINFDFIKKYLFVITILILYFKNPINKIFQKLYIYPLILIYIIYKNYNKPENLLILCPLFFILVGILRTNKNKCKRKIEKFSDTVECPYNNKDDFIHFNYDKKIPYKFILKRNLCNLFNDNYTCEYHPNIEKVICWKVIYDDNDKPELDEIMYNLDGTENFDDFKNDEILPSEKTLGKETKEYKIFEKQLK